MITLESLLLGAVVFLLCVAWIQHRAICKLTDLAATAATVQRHHVEAWALGAKSTAETLLRHEKMFTLINAVQANDASAARAAFFALYGREPGARVN